MSNGDGGLSRRKTLALVGGGALLGGAGVVTAGRVFSGSGSDDGETSAGSTGDDSTTDDDYSNDDTGTPEDDDNINEDDHGHEDDTNGESSDTEDSLEDQLPRDEDEYVLDDGFNFRISDHELDILNQEYSDSPINLCYDEDPNDGGQEEIITLDHDTVKNIMEDIHGDESLEDIDRWAGSYGLGLYRMGGEWEISLIGHGDQEDPTRKNLNRYGIEDLLHGVYERDITGDLNMGTC